MRLDETRTRNSGLGGHRVLPFATLLDQEKDTSGPERPDEEAGNEWDRRAWRWGFPVDRPRAVPGPSVRFARRWVNAVILYQRTRRAVGVSPRSRKFRGTRPEGSPRSDPTRDYNQDESGDPNHRPIGDGPRQRRHRLPRASGRVNTDAGHLPGREPTPGSPRHRQPCQRPKGRRDTRLVADGSSRIRPS